MKIVEVPIGQLTFNKENVRLNLTKKDAAFDSLLYSISYFGLQYPLLIDKDYNVVCGNQILKVLKLLNYEQVPCIVTQVPSDKHWALAISINKIRGDWSIYKLEKIFKTRQISQNELKALGFTKEEISCLANLDKFDDLAIQNSVQGQGELFE